MANETEREQWSGGMGRVWVDRQADLDRLMAAATDLLMDRADVRPGQLVLDVGCGAGDSTLAAAQALGPEGRVTGLDLAPQLLDVARGRAAEAGLSNVALAQGDAQTDQAPGGPFDRIISRFGVMFFADPVAAFANLRAQMTPGARLVAVAWGPAEANPWFSLPARIAAARFGPPPPSQPGAPGALAFADPGRVLPLLAAAGLRDPEVEEADVTLAHPDAEGLASLATEVGPAARLLRLKEATPADRAALRAEIARGLAAFGDGAGVRIPARLVIYRAGA